MPGFLSESLYCFQRFPGKHITILWSDYEQNIRNFIVGIFKRFKGLELWIFIAEKNAITAPQGEKISIAFDVAGSPNITEVVSPVLLVQSKTQEVLAHFQDEQFDEEAVEDLLE